MVSKAHRNYEKKQFFPANVTECGIHLLQRGWEIAKVAFLTKKHVSNRPDLEND
jgi:hypothetical protein